MGELDPSDIPFLILLVFAFLHVLYFMIYYGRYSRLNQKLAKVDRMEKSGLIAQSSIDLTRINTNLHIQKIKKFCYLPNTIILLAQWIFNGVYFGKSFGISNFLEPIYIGLAGAFLILLGNITKGAQIFDPNRMFFNRGRF
jgi:hypothetical protein